MRQSTLLRLGKKAGRGLEVRGVMRLEAAGPEINKASIIKLVFVSQGLLTGK